MKTINSILLGVICLACAPSDSYTLEGTLPADSKVKEVYLLSQEGKGADTLARSKVKSDGRFILRGKAGNGLLYFNMGSRGGRIYFYPETGKYRLEKVGDGYQVIAEHEGLQSRLNAHFNEVEKNSKAMFDLQRRIEQAANDEDLEKLNEDYERLWKNGNDLLVNMIVDFQGENVAATIVRDNLWILGYDFKLFTRAVEAMGDGPDSEARSEVLEKYGIAQQKQLTGMAPDFTLPDVKGKKVKLSDYKGKYLLIDFWASWCKPCRAKIKELKKEYARLQELGVEVIAISCDKKKEDWLKAIDEDQPMWKQLIVDKEVNGSDVGDDYKVEFLPTLYLISPDGIVLDTNPNMKEIERIVGKS